MKPNVLMGRLLLCGAALCLAGPALAVNPGDVTIPTPEQPVPGEGLTGFDLVDNDNVKIWSSHAAPSNDALGWRYILLADIDGDGKDDLCGSYGYLDGSRPRRAFGCVRNDANRFTGPLLQVSAFHGPLDDSIHSTIQLVELDGFRHLCGRAPDGIRCHRFANGAFQASALLAPQFSNASQWNGAPYYATFGFGNLTGGGVVSLCGRGMAGVLCYRRSATGDFQTSPMSESAFSDGNGWANPQYYETVRFVALAAGGIKSICGRGISGIICSTYNSARGFPISPSLLTQQFSDGNNWNDPRYYPSIRFGDVNGDRATDVCGRGTEGLYCGLGDWSRERFSNAFRLVQTEMSDANGWGVPRQSLASMLMVDFDGDGKDDVCGLNGNQFFCAPSTSSALLPSFGPLVRRIQAVIAYDRVVAGRIYASSPPVGFCFAQADGAVSCTYQYRRP